MATKKPRINITFEETTNNLFSALARQEHKSIASLARELVLEALEIREDFYLSKVAEKLDVDGAKTYEHENAWG